MPARLGQNFLKDKVVVEKIISAADLSAADFVLEIGPGKGILTEELAKCAGKVVAVELDRNLIQPLKNKFRDAKNIEIIEGDILKINLFPGGSTSGTPEVEPPGYLNYKVIANIPYYITSPIIRLFLESQASPSEMILMVQKEVAERIVAKPGQMSILAISVQYYADAEILFYVDKNSFDPVPEVDSAVIKITPHNHFREPSSRKQFFQVVKAGFSAKRKTLVNNLANSLQLDKKAVVEKIKTASLEPAVRAQELSIADWKKLAELL